MNAKWTQILERIDALRLRERIFLLASVIAVCALSVDTVLLSPAKNAQQQLLQSFDAQGVELDRLQKVLHQLAPPLDASQSVREALAQVEEHQQSLKVQIRSLSTTSQGGLGLEEVLVQFLRRQDQLRLVSLTAIPPYENTNLAADTTGTAIKQLPPGLRRRSLVLKVAGPYPELVRYLKTLEGALPNLRWGDLHLSSAKAMPELSLQVSILEASP